MARAFLSRRLVPSLNSLSKRLPFAPAYLDAMLVSLLVSCNFDLTRVEYSLFNMVGLVEQRPEATLDAARKQAFYEEARAPVKRLRTEILAVRGELALLADSECEEARAKRRQLSETSRRMRQAMQNAARDIYERVNSKNNNMVKLRSDAEVFSVDLHGLHIGEAKEIIDEFVRPVLDVAKHIVVITGRGVHSQRGRAVLKEAVREHFVLAGVKCEDVVGNDGALCVYF